MSKKDITTTEAGQLVFSLVTPGQVPPPSSHPLSATVPVPANWLGVPSAPMGYSPASPRTPTDGPVRDFGPSSPDSSLPPPRSPSDRPASPLPPFYYDDEGCLCVPVTVEDEEEEEEEDEGLPSPQTPQEEEEAAPLPDDVVVVEEEEEGDDVVFLYEETADGGRRYEGWKQALLDELVGEVRGKQDMLPWDLMQGEEELYVSPQDIEEHLGMEVKYLVDLVEEHGLRVTGMVVFRECRRVPEIFFEDM